MRRCTFDLNDKPMSRFDIGAASFPAFSGLDGYVNKRSAACIPGRGPIPPGAYYIFDRQSGGLLGPLRDLFTGRDEWFALYADDDRIDDETFCQRVKSGEFRLHPKGTTGRSDRATAATRMELKCGQNVAAWFWQIVDNTSGDHPADRLAFMRNT